MNRDAIEERTEELKKVLGEIEMEVQTQGYTLADAMREGQLVTGHKKDGWANDNFTLICGLSSAYLAARARGLVE